MVESQDRWFRYVWRVETDHRSTSKAGRPNKKIVKQPEEDKKITIDDTLNRFIFQWSIYRHGSLQNIMTSYILVHTNFTCLPSLKWFLHVIR